MLAQKYTSVNGYLVRNRRRFERTSGSVIARTGFVARAGFLAYVFAGTDVEILRASWSDALQDDSDRDEVVFWAGVGLVAGCPCVACGARGLSVSFPGSLATARTSMEFALVGYFKSDG